MAGRLEGKVAVVTGAASGIGLATAERFVAEGALVVAGDVQDEKGAMLERRFGGRLLYQRCDVTDDAAVKALIGRAVEAFGGLDVLFNNAGVAGGMTPLVDLEAEAFDKIIAVLLRSVVSGTRHAIAPMKARGGGSIINTASVAALSAGWAPIAYSTAKGAVLHFSKLAAAELSRENIRVNAVLPGLVATSIFGSALGMPREQADQLAAMIAAGATTAQPIPKAGMPEDIANAVLFLASDEARFVSGAQLLIDGGLTTGPRHSWDPMEPGPMHRIFGLPPGQPFTPPGGGA